MIVVDQQRLEFAANALGLALSSAKDLNGTFLMTPEQSKDRLLLAARLAIASLMGPPCNGVLGSDEQIIVRNDSPHIGVMKVTTTTNRMNRKAGRAR